MSVKVLSHPGHRGLLFQRGTYSLSSTSANVHEPHKRFGNLLFQNVGLLKSVLIFFSSGLPNFYTIKSQKEE